MAGKEVGPAQPAAGAIGPRRADAPHAPGAKPGRSAKPVHESTHDVARPSAAHAPAQSSALAVDEDSDEPTATVPPQRIEEPVRVQRDTTNIFRQGEQVADIYEIGEILGSGGMGQVFAAVDRCLDREVAIKACWPWVERSVLHTEARALAAVHHPGIVTVHTMGVHRDVDFIVMERLHGRTLHDHVQQRKDGLPFSAEEALDILIEMAEAVAAVHRAGFIHRDLKPANVMLVHGRRPVLLDLGVSFHTDQLEQENRMAGSPHYIAPEVVGTAIQHGQAHLIDVYALGIIAFEMLSGQRPFENEDTVQLLEMHLRTDVPRLAARVPGVLPQLDALVAEMMAKRPMDRPQSATVVAARLRELRRSVKRGRAGSEPAGDQAPRSFSRVFG